MSDNLDWSIGKPAMAYVGDEPWHGLGEKLNSGASIETWIKAAGLELNSPSSPRPIRMMYYMPRLFRFQSIG